MILIASEILNRSIHGRFHSWSHILFASNLVGRMITGEKKKEKKLQVQVKSFAIFLYELICSMYITWTLTKLKLNRKEKQFYFFIYLFIHFLRTHGKQQREADKTFDSLTLCLTWSWAYESHGSTVRIISSIRELLLLIYKFGFYGRE